jgi:hypothetical protein
VGADTLRASGTNLASVVNENKLELLPFHFPAESRVTFVLLFQLGKKCFVAGFGVLQLFVQDYQHPRGLLFNEIKNNLVVDVVRRFKWYLLTAIEFFFQLERVLVKVLLKLFVCLEWKKTKHLQKVGAK